MRPQTIDAKITLHGRSPEGRLAVSLTLPDGQTINFGVVKGEPFIRWRYPDRTVQNHWAGTEGQYSIQSPQDAFELLMGGLSCAIEDQGIGPEDDDDDQD